MCNVFFKTNIPLDKRDEKYITLITDELPHIIDCMANLFPDATCTDMPIPSIMLSDLEPVDSKYRGVSYYDLYLEAKKISEQIEKCDENVRELSRILLGNLYDHIHSEEKEYYVSDDDLFGYYKKVKEKEKQLDPKSKKIFKDLEKIINKLRNGNIKNGGFNYENIIFGCYDNERHMIVLYYKNIEKYVKRIYGFTPKMEQLDFLYRKNLDKYAALIKTLAHELFHSFQYFKAIDNYGKKYNGKNKEKVEIVKEASADFFALLYCMQRQEIDDNEGNTYDLVAIARNRFNCWKENINNDWPYAKALCFLTDWGNATWPPKDINQGIRKFRCIFYESQNTIVGAYDLLIEKNSRLDF